MIICRVHEFLLTGFLLHLAKISQAFQSNKTRSPAFPLKTADKVVLSTLHEPEFQAGDPNCVAKFRLRFDGPFIIKVSGKG